MGEKLLNKNITVEDNRIIITKNIEIVMDRREVNVKIQEIQARMEGLSHHNKEIVKEYNQLAEDKIELENYLPQLEDEKELEVIK